MLTTNVVVDENICCIFGVPTRLTTCQLAYTRYLLDLDAFNVLTEKIINYITPYTSYFTLYNLYFIIILDVLLSDTRDKDLFFYIYNLYAIFLLIIRIIVA